MVGCIPVMGQIGISICEGISHEGKRSEQRSHGYGVRGWYSSGPQNRSSAWWGFYPGQVSFGAYNEMAEASNSQVAEFMMILSSIEGGGLI